MPGDSCMASDKKVFSRRHLLSWAGGALGIFVAGKLARPTMDATTSPMVDDLQPDGARSDKEHDVTARRDEPRVKNRVRNASSEAFLALGAVGVGTQLGPWRVAEIHDFHFGAIPVVLESPASGRYQVDVLRRDPRRDAVPGIAETRHLSLFLANQGSGNTSTDEHQGLGLMTLAAAIRESEKGTPPPRKVLTFAARGARYPRAGYNVLV